jgi:hypothetical protein
MIACLGQFLDDPFSIPHSPPGASFHFLEEEMEAAV